MSDDDFIGWNYSKYQKDSKYKTQWDRNAILGLKALENIRHENFDYDQGDIFWFLFEDQTIGLPSVANLINNGMKKDELVSLIKNTEKMTKSDENIEPADKFAFEVECGNWEDMMIKFADECYKEKDNIDFKNITVYNAKQILSKEN